MQPIAIDSNPKPQSYAKRNAKAEQLNEGTVENTGEELGMLWSKYQMQDVNDIVNRNWPTSTPIASHDVWHTLHELTSCGMHTFTRRPTLFSAHMFARRLALFQYTCLEGDRNCGADYPTAKSVPH
eukprot:1443824-Amphidinium_carterae.1